MPARISGSAPGITTSTRVRARLAPRLRADQISTWSMPRAPLNADKVIGSMQPMKIITTLEALP